MEACSVQDFRAWCKTMNLEMRKGLTKAQQEVFLRSCREKMRKARIVQVRHQESKFSAQQVQLFLEKKQMRTDAIIRKLKEEWEDEQQFRVQQLEERCCFALNNMGEGHRAAAMLMSEKMSNAKQLEASARENQMLELQRYKQALQEEYERKEQEEELQRLANKRKKTKEVAACLERSIVRFATHTLGKNRKKQRCFGSSGDDTEESPIGPFKPSTYKYTFFHSIPFAKPPDDGDRAGVDTNAWKAAAARKAELQQQKEMQLDIRKTLKRRMFLRGQAASSRVMMQKRVEDLQRELERAERLDRETKRRTVLEQNAKRLRSRSPSQPAESPAKQNIEVCVVTDAHEANEKQDVRLEATANTVEINLTDPGKKQVRIIVPPKAPKAPKCRSKKPNRQLLAIASLQHRSSKMKR